MDEVDNGGGAVTVGIDTTKAGLMVLRAEAAKRGIPSVKGLVSLAVRKWCDDNGVRLPKAASVKPRGAQ